MGTSSMYGGQNRSRLIPSDFDEGSDNDTDALDPQDETEAEKESTQNKDSKEEVNPREEQKEYSRYPWRDAKSYMSKLASRTNGYNSNGAVSKCVKAYGGAKNAAVTARSGIDTAIKIGVFFGRLSEIGITETLSEYKISISGRRAKDILNELANILAPAPNLKEEAVARKALLNTMSEIYQLFEDESVDITILDSVDEAFFNTLISHFFISYIYERLIHDLGSSIETKAENSESARRVENEIKEYIKSKVTTTLRDKSLSSITTRSKSVFVLVKSLYEQCYKVLEDQL